MKSVFKLIVAAAIGSTCVLSLKAQVVAMQPLTTFGPNGDGSLRAGDVSFLISTNEFERGMAYNPTTGHLLVVDRSANSSLNSDVHVLDGQTGADLGILDTNGILSGGNTSFPMNMIGVADDGAIYAANLSNGTGTNSPEFRLYRWASEGNGQQRVYPQSFGVADPGNGIDTSSFQKRWGDTLTVRGSGTNTQVLIANRGTLVSVFRPTDESMATFVPTPLTSDAGVGALGYGLTFGAGDTFWGTAGASTNSSLYHMQFDLVAGTATKIHTLTSAKIPNTITPILCMPASNLLTGITMVPGPDVIRLYDISDPSSPVLLDRKPFATANTNLTYSGALALGTNGVLYALDADNGIMAFALTNVPSNPLAPSFYQNPPASLTVVAGGTVTLTSAADGTAPISYQWKAGTNIIVGATNATLVLTNLQIPDSGSYSVEASNSAGTTTSSTTALTVSAIPVNTLVFYDPIGNAPAAAIAGQNNWTTGTGSSPVAEAGSLTYSGFADSISNKMTWGLTTMTLQRTNILTTAGSLFVSFLYQLDSTSTVPAVGANGGAVGGFQNNSESSVYYGKLIVRTNTSGPGKFTMGISKRAGETLSGFATNVLNLGDTVLVVMRYTFKDGSTTDDTTDLWINPDSSTFGASNAPPPSVGENGIVTMTGTAQTDTALIDRFTFRQSSGPSKTYADEVRVGLAWSDVTPAYVAPSPTLLIGRSGANVTVSWPAVYTGFTLEGTATLTSPSWTSISYSTSGGTNTAIIPASSGVQFIRLSK